MSAQELSADAMECDYPAILQFGDEVIAAEAEELVGWWRVIWVKVLADKVGEAAVHLGYFGILGAQLGFGKTNNILRFGCCYPHVVRGGGVPVATSEASNADCEKAQSRE